MIAGLVLAAGESRRMGQPKLLLPFGQATVIETIFSQIKASKLEQTLVVVSPQDRIITELAKNFSLSVVINPHPEKGMLSSIICGLDHLPLEAEAVVIILGDQPTISSSVIDLLMVSYRVKMKGIVVPVYQGKRGHPVLIDLKYRQAIIQLNPEIGLKGLLRENAEDVLEIPVGDVGVLLDIDTPEDYLQLVQQPFSEEES